MKVDVKPFSERDASEVFSMLESTEEQHVGGLTYSEKAVQNWHVTRAQDLILVATLRKETVGFIATKLNDPELGAACIDCLVVKPKYRGQRIGQQLLNQCLSSLKARGVFFVHIHVRPDFPRTLNFWDKNNFEGKHPLLWMHREI